MLPTGEAAVAKIKASTQSESVEVLPLDLSSLTSTRSFGDALVARGTPIKLLINNAGIMMLPEYKTTVDGVEMQWGVVHTHTHTHTHTHSHTQTHSHSHSYTSMYMQTYSHMHTYMHT